MAENGRNGRGVLTRPTTGEQVADDLRAQIFAGRLLPGSALRETSLASEYDTSRRSIQDALAVLAAEGLVRHERHRGAKVAQLSRRDVEDLYRVRLTLESMAARAADTSDPADRTALTRALDDLRRATDTGSALDIVASDVDFHRAVVGLLGSQRIDEFFTAVATEMRFALTVLESVAQEAQMRPEEAFAEHEAIHDALLAGDLDRAETLIGEHVAVNRDRLCRIVDSLGT